MLRMILCHWTVAKSFPCLLLPSIWAGSSGKWKASSFKPAETQKSTSTSWSIRSAPWPWLGQKGPSSWSGGGMIKPWDKNSSAGGRRLTPRCDSMDGRSFLCHQTRAMLRRPRLRRPRLRRPRLRRPRLRRPLMMTWKKLSRRLFVTTGKGEILFRVSFRSFKDNRSLATKSSWRWRR